jgi:hypothetical protein
MVAKSGTAIESEFKQHRYGTKTRGERTVPAVRPAASMRSCSAAATCI